MKSFLLLEICKKILINIGAASSNLGLRDPLLEVKLKDIICSYSSAAKLDLGEQQMQALFVDFSDEGEIEWSLIFQVSDSPPCKVHYKSNDKEETGSLFTFQNNHFQNCSTLEQSKFLLGMEMILDQGFLWKSLSDYDNLYRILVEDLKNE